MAGTIPAKLEQTKILRVVMFALARGGGVEQVAKAGFTYAQISRAIDLLIDDGLIEEREGGYALSVEGARFLTDNITYRKRIPLLEPLNQYRVAQMPLLGAYLPSKGSLKEINNRVSNQ